jgi:Outer membrane protein beta-barrel domain
LRKLAPTVVMCVAVLLVDVRSASAQERWNVDLGYQFQRLSFEPKETNFPIGVNIAAEFPVTNPWSVVGQFDWSQKEETDVGVETEVNLSTFAGGVRWTRPTTQGATPYVHALFGVMRSQAEAELGAQEVETGSDSDPMLQVGAGVAFPIGRLLKGLGQVDYRRILQGDDEAGGVNVFRFVVGVRWSF